MRRGDVRAEAVISSSRAMWGVPRGRIMDGQASRARARAEAFISSCLATGSRERGQRLNFQVSGTACPEENKKRAGVLIFRFRGLRARKRTKNGQSSGLGRGHRLSGGAVREKVAEWPT